MSRGSAFRKFCAVCVMILGWVPMLLAGELQSFVPPPSSSDYGGKYLFIFVSSSMPVDVLKNYIRGVEGIEDQVVFVLRGLVNDSITDTLKWVKVLLCEDSSSVENEQCVPLSFDINPVLYRMFAVDRVPTVVLLEDADLTSCADKFEGRAYKYVGDASIVYVLETFVKKGSFRAKGLIDKLRCPYVHCVE